MGDERGSGGTQLTRLGFGCVKLGSFATADGDRQAVRLIHAAVDAGVTFFDTADAYGSGVSERLLGKGLGARRDRVTIATKGGYVFRNREAAERVARRLAAPVVRGLRKVRAASSARTSSAMPGSAGAYSAQDFSVQHLRRAVDDSLTRLGTDHIDLFQLHGPTTVCADETLGLMAELIRAGKIREFGVGLEQLDHVAEWLAVERLSSIQLPFGILDPQARAAFPTTRQRAVRVVVRGIFGSGLFNAESAGAASDPNAAKVRLVGELRALAEPLGVSAHQLAMWWVLAQRDVNVALVGINSLEHLESTVRFVTAPLPDVGLVEQIDALVAARQSEGQA